MDYDYIIIQAGGRGSRLGYLTENKPKALVPVDNLPLIFHTFQKYPNKKYVIIADYKKDVLRKYLAAFADVKYQVVDAVGKGTCGGIKQAMDLIPKHTPFLLMWSDLILPDSFEFPNGACNNEISLVEDYVGISVTFPCRWKYEKGLFSEEKSSKHGVAGFFLFHDKSVISDVPGNGELVRWMKEKRLIFSEISLAGTREIGILSEYEKLAQVKTRPFNKITVDGAVLTKEPVDKQGEALAQRECAWYEKAKDKGISGIPKIYETSPLKMEFIRGKNIYECDFDYEDKRRILEKLVQTLRSLHESGIVSADSFSIKEAYFK